MSDDRWHRIEELFHEAASLAPVQRSEFLARVCCGDDEMRRQIESLLANDESNDDFVAAAIAKAMDQLPVEGIGQTDDLFGQRIGPYVITELIGAGGMGRVYAAEDSRLGRKVALKFLPDEFTHNPAAVERFRREARTLSALNHPNICTIHDIVEQDGRTFIVMEYLEGVPLRGPLPLDQMLKYAAQICSALDAAHRKGFIHRDLKPANIHVTATGIKLLDFGLARIARALDDTTLTQSLSKPGVLMGTPAYMAPEQVDGQTTDQRSDIFGFGALLYEMLSGRRAFAGESMARVLSAVLRDDPPPLQAPPALARIVMRCLDKDPAERFQSIAELKAALENILVDAPEEQPSIAVLPFLNLSADKENEYFSDGLAEEIINVLARTQGLKVIARTSAFAFRHKEQDVIKIGRALGVHNILEGSVRRAGSRIRITTQLLRAEDGSHLWAERYDREMTDVFGVQDEIASAIAAALKVRLSIEKDRPAGHDTQDKEAYHLYLRGRYLQNQRSPELMRKGMECFERAIEKDPSYALPYAGLSDLLCIAGFWGREPPNKIYPRAIAAATKALEIDEGLGDAYASLAFAKDLYRWDWARSEGEFKRALNLKPNSPLAHTWYSYHLSMLGRHDEAIEQARRGIDLDPLSISVNFGAVRAYFYARRYDEAIAQGRRGLELGLNDFPTLFQLGESFMQKGIPDEAIAFCQQSVDVSERHPVALGSLGHVYGLSGKREQARSIIEELTGLAERTYVPPATIAFVYLGLRMIDELNQWLEKAYLDRSAILPYLVASPSADELCSDLCFQELRRRMYPQ
jgi:serine/threonine protein kinase/Tfp pilus assembly protein PilF